MREVGPLGRPRQRIVRDALTEALRDRDYGELTEAPYANLPTLAHGFCDCGRLADLISADGRARCMECWCDRELRRPA